LSDGSPFLLVHGHSIALGAGASDQERLRFTRLVADRLGLAERNLAVGGAIAHWPTYGDVGDGGYPAVLGHDRVPVLGTGGVGLLFYGLNDLAVLGGRLRPYREAMRTMISRLRARVVSRLEGRHRARLELPPGLSGGTAAVGFTVAPDARAGVRFSTGDRLELTGGEVCFAGRANAVVKRLDIAVETEAIEIEISGAGVTVDYWQLEADPAPLVGVLTQFPPANYDLWAGWPASPVSDEDVVEALNPATRDVAAEFDSGVTLVELEDAFPDGYSVSWDCYPDDAGYARLAEVVLDQLGES
jgi:hypothetical protein